MAKTLDANIVTLLNSREGIYTAHLVWIIGKNRITGEEETTGVWDGPVQRDFTIDSEVRTYVGAGPLLEMDEFTASIGLKVQLYNVKLSMMDSKVIEAIRTYEPKLAKVRIHKVFFDPVNNTVVGDPIRVFKGVVNEAPIVAEASGGTYTVSLVLASATRSLTRKLSLYRSHAAQRAVDADDDFRKYGDVSRSFNVKWGDQK